MFVDSEVNAELRAQHGRVLDMARAAGPKDLLEVRLDEVGVLAQVESIGQFHERLVVLDTAIEPKQESISLGSL